MASIAEERVRLILGKALDEHEEDVDTALRIAEANSLSIPERYRLRICDGCDSMLHPGKNCSVRVSGDIIYSCESCGTVNRHGY